MVGRYSVTDISAIQDSEETPISVTDKCAWRWSTQTSLAQRETMIQSLAGCVEYVPVMPLWAAISVTRGYFLQTRLYHAFISFKSSMAFGVYTGSICKTTGTEYRNIGELSCSAEHIFTFWLSVIVGRTHHDHALNIRLARI